MCSPCLFVFLPRYDRLCRQGDFDLATISFECYIFIPLILNTDIELFLFLVSRVCDRLCRQGAADGATNGFITIINYNNCSEHAAPVAVAAGHGVERAADAARVGGTVAAP